MIQEVVSIDPELQTLGFGYLEVLEDRHIPVEVCGAVGDRQKRRSVLPNRHRSREATSVNELMRTEAGLGIARHQRIKLNRVGAKDGLIVDRNSIRSGTTRSTNRPRNDRRALPTREINLI